MQSSARFLLAVGASFWWGSQNRQLLDFGRLVGCVRWQVQECRTWCLLAAHWILPLSPVYKQSTAIRATPTRLEEQECDENRSCLCQSSVGVLGFA